MGAVLDRIALAPIHDQTVRALVEGALLQFQAFVLVLLRFAGLLTVGPVFGVSLVPANLRIFLVLILTLLVTPTVQDRGRILFQRLDQNHDGLLTADEVPDALATRFQTLHRNADLPPTSALTLEQFRLPTRFPKTLADAAWTGVGEFALGLVLGIGVLTILSGLQLAGDLIDQQTGASLGEIANPGLDITGSVTGQFLFTFATTVLLVMQPTGYHLTMISALVDTFQTMPPGDAFVSLSAIDLLRNLVHDSLVLGFQLAAPLLATMSLVALTMGFLGHSVPQINILVIGFPVRALISLSVLLLSLTGIAKMVIDVVPHAIDSLRQVLVGF